MTCIPCPLFRQIPGVLSMSCRDSSHVPGTKSTREALPRQQFFEYPPAVSVLTIGTDAGRAYGAIGAQIAMPPFFVMSLATLAPSPSRG
jgi:hypothetical protein